jgi:hypothetical protein
LDTRRGTVSIEEKKVFTVDDVTDEDRAVTAGQEDHSDPWWFAGDDADAPADTKKPEGS